MSGADGILVADGGGLPRLDWEAVAAARMAPRAAVEAWAEALQETLGRTTPVLASRHLLVIAEERATGVTLLQAGELARERIDMLVGDAAREAPCGRIPVVAWDTPDDYYGWIDWHHAPGEHPLSGGIFVPTPSGEIVLPEAEGGGLTLAHELSHARIAHRAPPAWLDEGLARAVESLCGRAVMLDADKAGEISSWWREHGLGLLWSGEAFKRTDEGFGLAYDLAELLVARLARRPAVLRALVAAAGAADGGDGALREHGGIGLCELAAQQLGPGRWNRPQDLPPTAADPGADAVGSGGARARSRRPATRA